MVLTSISEWARIQFESLNDKERSYLSSYAANDRLAKFLIEEVNIPKSSAYKIQNAVYCRDPDHQGYESKLNKYMIRVLEKGLIEGNAKGRSRDTHIEIPSIRDKEKLYNYIKNKGVSGLNAPCTSCGDQPDEIYMIPTSCHINKSPSPLGCIDYKESDPGIYCCAHCLPVFIDYLVLDFAILVKNLVNLFGSQKKVAEVLNCPQSVVSKITNENLEQIYLPCSLVQNLYINTLKLHGFYKKELITEEQLYNFLSKTHSLRGIEQYFIPQKKFVANLDDIFRLTVEEANEDLVGQNIKPIGNCGLLSDIDSIRAAQERGLPVILLTANARIACYFSIDWKSTINNIFEFIAGAHKYQASSLFIVEPRYCNDPITKKLEFYDNRLRTLNLLSWPWKFDSFDEAINEDFIQKLDRENLRKPFFEELKNISPDMDEEKIWSTINEDQNRHKDSQIRVEEKLKESLLSFINGR